MSTLSSPREKDEGQMPQLEHIANGLTTVEVAALPVDNLDPIPDVESAERALLDLAPRGRVRRVPLGQDARRAFRGLVEPRREPPTRTSVPGSPSGQVVAHPPSEVHLCRDLRQ